MGGSSFAVPNVVKLPDVTPEQGEAVIRAYFAELPGREPDEHALRRVIADLTIAQDPNARKRLEVELLGLRSAQNLGLNEEAEACVAVLLDRYHPEMKKAGR